MSLIPTRNLPRAWPLPALLLALALPCAARTPASAATQGNQGRVIVLGFDGADARTASELMDKGQLPNLAALRASGSFTPLDTTNPAESPVSWAALNCGQNPAKTGVPGFVRRQLPPSKEKKLDRAPMPDVGHLKGPTHTPIETLSGTPIPTWSPNALGAACGLAAAALFLAVFLLLRMRAGLSVVLALVLGAGGFVGGRALRGYLPSKVPVWNNPLEAVPFWETAAAAGVPCVVLDAAQAFDREPVEGAKVLAGLGVPDARGSINSFFLYTSSEDELVRAPRGRETDSSGSVFRIDEHNGRFDSLLPGPVNFWKTDGIRSELDAVKEEQNDPNLRYKRSTQLNALEVEIGKRLKSASEERICLPVSIVRNGAKASVSIGHETQELEVGAWSQWYSLSFELNPLLKVRALARAKLLSLGDPDVSLYVDALQYDPANPPFWQPISQPADYAEQLAHACGPFETVGWACMNLPLKDSVIDSVSFMQDIEFTLGWREKMTYQALEKKDWRVLMSCESTPDRVQHMMYQYYDTGHPMYSAQKAAQTMNFRGQEITLADAIPASYRAMDAMVGEVVKQHMQPGDTLIVCSDHGFQSFRRQVHINNWLIKRGFAVIKEGATAADRGTKYPNSYLDWSKTRAYALGLGSIYVNQQGREGQGIVPASEARALLEEIRTAFLAETDPETGEKIGKDAYVMADIHRGEFLDREADMNLCFNAGYRVSWLTTSGGMSGENDGSGVLQLRPTIVPNDNNWSGDHVTVDPSLVQGIFFSNRKLAQPAERVSLLQIAPTVLTILGVEVPKAYDMPALQFAP